MSEANAAEKRNQSIKQLRVLGDLVQVAGSLIGVGGLIVGLVVAFQREDNGFRNATRPYMAEGIGMVVGSVVLGLVLALLGYWAQAWAWANDPPRTSVPPPPPYA